MEADSIDTERLLLTPLVADDAGEMAEVLADPELHRFIEVWRNWLVRRRADAQAVGTVQATLYRRQRGWSAQIAWVVGVPYQGHGYAAEAARALVGWLADRDVHEVVAHIHPDHAASARVAHRAGLQPTDDRVDGEVVWRGVTGG